MIFFLFPAWAEENWISGELAQVGQGRIGFQAGLPKLGIGKSDIRRACPSRAKKNWISGVLAQAGQRGIRYQAGLPGLGNRELDSVRVSLGVIQWHYDVQEYDFYAFLLGIGRVLGISANLIWDRALGCPLERPKSITTAMPEDIAAGKEVIIED